MGAQGVSSSQAPQFVVQFTSQFLTFIIRLVVVEVEVQCLFFCQWQIVVQVYVLFLPEVFNIGCVESAAEIFSEAVACTKNVS